MLFFDSPLSPEECKDRLAATTERDTLWRAVWSRTPGVVARFDDERFRLRLRRGNWSNSYDPLFYGSIQPAAAGARITGRFRQHPLTFGFMVAWFAGLFLIGTPIVVNSGSALWAELPRVDRQALFGVLLPVGMLILGVAHVSFGTWLGRSCRRRLQAFLCETLDAVEIAEE